MALIRKQIFRPSKDENLQQFLAKDGAEMKWGQPASKNKAKTRARAEGKIIGVAPKEGDVAKKVKSEPKSPWDDESDAATDQGSDNSNSADDRIKKARRIEARPKSTFSRPISEEEYEQDEESQSFKNWQAKNAEQEQSPVKKAVQDAWFEKQEKSVSMVDKLTGKKRGRRFNYGNKRWNQPTLADRVERTGRAIPRGTGKAIGTVAEKVKNVGREVGIGIKEKRGDYIDKKGVSRPPVSMSESTRKQRQAQSDTAYGGQSFEQHIKAQTEKQNQTPKKATEAAGLEYAAKSIQGEPSYMTYIQEGDFTSKFWFGKARSRKDKTRTTEVTQEKLQRRAGLRAQVGKIDHDTMDKKQKATYNKNIASRMGKQNKRDPGLMYSAPQQGMSQDNRLYRAQIGAAEDIANTKKSMQGEPIDMNYIQKGVWEAWLEKRGPIDRLTGGRVKLETNPAKQARPQKPFLGVPGVEAQLKLKRGGVADKVTQKVGGFKETTPEQKTKAAGLDYAAKEWVEKEGASNEKANKVIEVR